MKLSRFDRIMAIARHPDYVKDYIPLNSASRSREQSKKSDEIYSEEELLMMVQLSSKWKVDHPPFPFIDGARLKRSYFAYKIDKAAVEVTSDARPEGNPFTKRHPYENNTSHYPYNNAFNYINQIESEDTNSRFDQYTGHLYLHLKIDLFKNKKEILAAIADILSHYVNEDKKQKGRKTKIDPWKLFDTVNMRFPLSFSRYKIEPNLSRLRKSKRYEDDKSIKSAKWDKLETAYAKALRMIEAVTPKINSKVRPK